MQAELLNSCLFLSISNRSKFILLKHCQFKLKVYYIRSTKKELQFSSWWLSIALLIAVAALTVTKSAANRWAAPMRFCLFVCLESTINLSHYLFINWQWRIIGPVVQENAEIMTWKRRSTNKLTFPWCSKILDSIIFHLFSGENSNLYHFTTLSCSLSLNFSSQAQSHYKLLNARIFW